MTLARRRHTRTFGSTRSRVGVGMVMAREEGVRARCMHERRAACARIHYINDDNKVNVLCWAGVRRYSRWPDA